MCILFGGAISLQMLYPFPNVLAHRLGPRAPQQNEREGQNENTGYEDLVKHGWLEAAHQLRPSASSKMVGSCHLAELILKEIGSPSTGFHSPSTSFAAGAAAAISA